MKKKTHLKDEEPLKIIDDFTDEDKITKKIRKTKKKWVLDSNSKCSIRIANKIYSCDNCWNIINKGERYLEVCFFHEDFNTFLIKRICSDCQY